MPRISEQQLQELTKHRHLGVTNEEKRLEAWAACGPKLLAVAKEVDDLLRGKSIAYSDPVKHLRSAIAACEEIEDRVEV